MAEQRKCNWKTDLILIESFYELVEDGSSVPTAIPDDSIDFKIVYRCGPDKRHYTAERQNGIYLGCKKIDDNNLAVFLPLSRHSLGRGLLSRELFLSTPDDNFDHGVRNICIPASTGCILSEGPSDGDTPPEVTVIVERLLKGDKGDPGDPGEAGQITSATASIDNTTGTPSVKIELGGTPEKRTIDLKFSGLKGESGEPDGSFVRYDEVQDLSNAQKDTVLSNIGLDFIQLDYSLLGTTLDDSTAALVENANGLILLNVPNNERPVIFPRCNFANNAVYFNSWRGIYLVDQIIYNVSTKAFSAVWSTEVPINSVKYDGGQKLTDVQKSQARANIGARSADELLADDDFIAQLKVKLGIG